jgi:hypothetical protein
VWKKIVFQKLDENIADEGGVDPTIPATLMSDTLETEKLAYPEIDKDIILHQCSKSPEQEHLEFGRSSKQTN